VESVHIASLSALKTFDPPVESLVGQVLESASRQGKYLKLRFEESWMVVHLARGGWLHWRQPPPASQPRPGKGPLAMRVRLSRRAACTTPGDAGPAAIDLTEQGTEKRLAVWIVRDPAEVAQVATLGPEPLEAGFGPAELAARFEGRSGNLKGVLRDQSVVAGVGNAYSDEILHRARLSPFKAAGSLGEGELARLHEAMVSVLTEAVDRAAVLPPSELKGDKRTGLSVHGRAGDACPVCGDRIHQVAYAGRSTEYCPKCQTGGRVLADRRLSRLLK
jgi:formamidopyrimidine-DNA glycosylase